MADEEQLFDRAKEALAKSEIAAAYSLFRRASRSRCDYAFCSKASRFAKKLSSHADELNLKTLKLALLSSTTSVFLEPLIKHFGMVFGINFELLSGDFGNWRNDILDENSWLYKFAPDFVFINTHYRDFPLPAFCDNPQEEAESSAVSQENFWKVLSERIPAKIIQNSIDTPIFESGGYASGSSENGRIRVLEKISEELKQRAFKNRVQILDLKNLQNSCGTSWCDMRTWYHGRQHPSLEALPLLAREFSKIAASCMGITKKVLVCDLDNTLWGGVIGEDGVSGIRLGAPDPVGEAFCDFQKYILELKERGILIAVASKNNFEDAKAPFEKHPSMKLKFDDVISFKANWERKSENIKQISEELSLGLDSFVFIDDNPIEIEEVSESLPMVECLKMPNDAAFLTQTLNAADFFNTPSISESDAARHKEYKANAARAQAAKSATSTESGDYLKNFDMRCKIMRVADNLDRCTQLINKTNQFNLTTRRYSDVEVKTLAENPDNCALCFEMSDKFGDSGIVGILIAKRKSFENAFEIDTLLMSCRVLGRGLEFFIINALFENAANLGVEKIFAEYIPTAKNAQVENFYEKCGFEKISDKTSKTYSKEVGSFEKIKNFISAQK